VKLHDSARKHFKRDRLTAADVLRAVEQPAYRAALDDEDDPRRWLLLGFDDAGRVLELVLLEFDSGETLVIHAMKSRTQYLDLLR
jgi:hypothetical protein